MTFRSYEMLGVWPVLRQFFSRKGRLCNTDAHIQCQPLLRIENLQVLLALRENEFTAIKHKAVMIMMIKKDFQMIYSTW